MPLSEINKYKQGNPKRAELSDILGNLITALRSHGLVSD